MNDLFYAEDIIEAVKLYLWVCGDEHDRDLIISFAAELLNVSEERVWSMIKG